MSAPSFFFFHCVTFQRVTAWRCLLWPLLISIKKVAITVTANSDRCVVHVHQLPFTSNTRRVMIPARQGRANIHTREAVRRGTEELLSGYVMSQGRGFALASSVTYFSVLVLFWGHFRGKVFFGMSRTLGELKSCQKTTATEQDIVQELV